MSRRKVSWLAAGALVAAGVSVAVTLGRRAWARERPPDLALDRGCDAGAGRDEQVARGAGGERDAPAPTRPMAAMRFLG